MNTLITPQIETIIAELYVIKIGNKQMTISVFNQMYKEICWDDDYNIIYPIWGKVNRDIEWIVFQKGNELRKCVMPRKERLESIVDTFEDYVTVNDKDLSEDIVSLELFKPELGIVNALSWDHSMSENERKAYDLYMFINRLGRERASNHNYITFIEFAKDKYISKLREYRNKVINENVARNNMIDTMNASRQIFIAV